jgi:ubiquinone/menaquinone biosynthesis C-methylase UbiE
VRSQFPATRIVEGVDAIMESSKTFLPAAGRDFLLPLYDPFVRLIGATAARDTLIAQASLRPGARVLDIGCGTGTLAVRIKKLQPDVDIVGLDPDPKALSRAERKARDASAAIRFDRGFADELPYEDDSFDRVLSSFMFHHLPTDVKDKTLSEVQRVLKPGGSFCLLDFGGNGSHGHGLMTHLFHADHRLSDNSEDEIVGGLRRAGFSDSGKIADGRMFFGIVEINFYNAVAA